MREETRKGQQELTSRPGRVGPGLQPAAPGSPRADDFHWATPGKGASPRPPSQLPRVLLWGLFACLVLGGVAVILLAAEEREEATAQAERPQRRGMNALKPGWPAPPDIPEGPPFVGEDKLDAQGYPLKRPDATVLLALLREQRFAELDAAMEAYQSAFEADPRKDAWPHHALGTFAVAHEEVGGWIDAWIEASPESFGAWAARGAWHMEMGEKARGGKFAAETTEAQHAALEAFNNKAAPDLGKALELRPKLVTALERLMWIARWHGDDQARDAFYQRAIEVCPRCLRVRFSYVLALAPRWGGSYEQMDAAAAKAPAARNPRLKLLAGVSAFDRCRTLREEGAFEAALIQCEAAERTGPWPPFACERARNLNHLERHVEALAPLDDALRRDPQHRGCLRARELARRRSKDFIGAAEDLLTLRRLDPHNERLEEIIQWTLQRLRYDAHEAKKAGHPQEEQRIRALANKILPGGGDERPAGGATDDELPGLFAAVQANPDDFEAHRRLDYALAARGRFDEVIEMWDTFITAHPDEPRAWQERGGARWHHGDHDAAIADNDHACDLGLAMACNIAKSMRARLSRSGR